MNSKEGKQLSIFDVLGISSKETHKEFGSDELQKFIEKLERAKEIAKNKEVAEQRKKEREEAERRAREEKERKEAHIKEVTCMDLPLDWYNAFNSDVRTQGIHAESISDGLILSISNLGKVDIEYISSVTGADYKTVIGALKGSIYQNPDTWGECFYKGWETAEEYLSGNLMRKWKTATAANKEYNGYFADNIKAIEKLLPPIVATKDIYITLGSPWVPADIIDDFIVHLFGNPFNYVHCSDYDNKALSEITVAIDDMYDTVYFDELGITQLFIDEAHNFKNVPLETKANMVLGINRSGSKRCQDMMDKVRMVQKSNDGKGVVFATGTPITNSITDAYIMQQYLQSGELGMLDLQNFDNLIRIDNYLDSLEEHLDKLKLSLERLKEKEHDIRLELSKEEGFTDKIEMYKKKVEELDKKLGVDKK